MPDQMRYERLKKFIRWEPPPVVDHACRYLEDRGLRFATDYGTLNAVNMAARMCCDALEEETADEVGA